MPSKMIQIPAKMIQLQPQAVPQSICYSYYPDYIQTNFSPYEIKQYEIYFAVYMMWVIIPSLYIIFVTGNLEMINMVWKMIHSGIFDAVRSVKNYLSNKMVFLMRYFGYYTFSTYTVVKNGRELFSSYSEHINVKTTHENIKQVDMAKYRICKWIDAQCLQYRRLNSCEPEVSDAKNDIYDFIIHSSLEYKQSRVHRGDLRNSTHTQFETNYRTYQRSFYIENYAELVVPKQSELSDATSTSSTAVPTSTAEPTSSSYEIIPICIKCPSTFYIEKNELYDKSFLQWYLLNRICRPDIAEYVGSSTTTYEVVLYHRDFIKYSQCDNCLCVFTKNIKSKTLDEIVDEISSEQEDTTKKTDFFMKLTNNQHIMVGTDYIIKVDTALNCPVYEINQKSVVSIDDDINDFCNQSEQSYTDDEDTEDENTGGSHNSSNNDSDSDSECVSDDSENEHDDDDDDEHDNTVSDKENITAEFEMIDTSS